MDLVPQLGEWHTSREVLERAEQLKAPEAVPEMHADLALPAHADLLPPCTLLINVLAMKQD